MPQHQRLDDESRNLILAAQGRPLFGLQFKLPDVSGADVAKDGRSPGRLMFKGNGVIERYFGMHSALDDGWFDTGDIATIDADGYLRNTDRSKDMIKSGGELISSLEIESIALEARRSSRCLCRQTRREVGRAPCSVCVSRVGSRMSAQQILDVFHERVPRDPFRIGFRSSRTCP